MVYDPESATDDSKVNKVFIDEKKYEMVREDLQNRPQGTGQMVVGRGYINWDQYYADGLIDDLKMWNRKLSDDEIVGMSN